MLGLYVLPLVMLIAGTYCAPATLFGAGGTVGYDSHINGTIGGHLQAERDFLSVHGGGRGIVGASWEPTLVGRGYAQLGDNIIGGDASLRTVIGNRWEPGFQGKIGLQNDGNWVLGLQPDSQLYNQLLLSPNVQVKTGDDARRMIGLPVETRPAAQPAAYMVPYPVPYYPNMAQAPAQ